MFCLPSQNGNPFFAMDVPGNADGYIEQQLTLPNAPTTFRFKSWGNLDPVTAKISIITTADDVEHVLETYTPPPLQNGGGSTCSGAVPIIKSYDLKAFAGKTVRVRIRATSSGNNGTIADFDNLSISATAPPPVSIEPQVFNGPLNPAVSNDCNCNSFSGTGEWSGDPVNTLTGNLSELATDLVIPGRGRFIELDRTYNAMDAAVTAKPGPFGFGWTHSYALNLTTDPKTGAVTVHQEGGATVTFSQPKAGTYTAPPYVTATLKAGAGGSLVFTLKNRKADTFNPVGQLISESDRNGYQTKLTYTGSGALTAVTDPGGRTLTFTTGANGLISQVLDPQGRKVTYTYDAGSNLIAVKNAGGGITAYKYDAHHRLLTVRNPNGGQSNNVYDAANQVVKQTDPAGRSTTWSYTATISAKNGANTTTITDAAGHISRRAFANYLLTSLTQGVGSLSPSAWTYTYDTAGNPASVKDPDGNVSRTSYDGAGNLLSRTDPLGRITRTTFNPFNDPVTITDPLGVATTTTYDARGNLLKVSRPLSGTAQASATTFAHGDAAHPGDVTAVSDPDRHVSTFTYDHYGNVVSRTDPNGDKITSTYNIAGFMLSTVAARGNAAGTPASFTTSYAYNAFGDVIQISDPLKHVTKLSYDANRNLTSVIDPNGHQTIYVYDPDNERTAIKRAGGTVLKTAYDGAGNVVSQTDALGHTVSYTHDAQNRLTVATDALLRATKFAFDASGNRVRSTDPSGETSTYGFDAANELVAIHYSDGTTPAVGFKYDANGRRVSMSDGTGVTSYQYDSLHRLTGVTNGAGQKISYRYDLAGRLTSMTYPNGHSITRSYDKAGRLVSVTDWLGKARTFTYNPDGKLTGAAYANKWNGTFTYDNDDRVTGIAYSQGTQKLLLTYKRDLAGRLVSESATSSIPGIPPATFPASLIGYDALNRCMSDSVSAAGYIYDGADRITNDSGALMSYDNADELTSISKGGHSSPLSHDPEGNRTTAAANKLTYDAENRMTAFGSLARYRYNGDGLRMAKVVGATSERYAWDQRQTDLPVIIQDGTVSYIYGPAQVLIERIDASNSVSYYHQDQLGSTRLLTKSTGAVAAAYTYDAYGKVIDSGGTALNPFMYAGQYTDSESGFQYLRGRYYDPATAQFPSRDPLVTQTRQGYAYASDDPINRTDPTGLGGICNTQGLSGSLGNQVNQAVQGVLQTLPASVPGSGVPPSAPAGGQNGGGQNGTGGLSVLSNIGSMFNSLAQNPNLNPTTAASTLPSDATVSPATCSAPQSEPGAALPGSFDVAPAGPPAESEGTGVSNPLLMQQQMQTQAQMLQTQSQINQSQNQATMQIIQNTQ